ncbi:hypothetical protein Q5741_02910 [Paenibacillus sp. JX-17]|uniref:YfhD family protein n=1 Tax=Paenibacillus lacisoli TaxID=3064525 RepID=A0ABT9C7Y7_9BACL|nr:hypothetical protein [Paenibacillus sp. JX-17]MDO7905361.1 hypothetical protein [Paenibacillus sp. JX-17]
MDNKDKKALDNRTPGFDSLPDPRSERPAATDSFSDIVGKSVEKLQKDFGGHPEDIEELKKKRDRS